MRRGWVVALAVASFFLVWAPGLVLLSEQVPVWVRPWITPASLAGVTTVDYLLVRNRKRPADPPRAPRTPDPDTRPATPARGRTLLIAHLAVCLGSVGLLSILITYGRGWVTAPAGATPEDGPTWYRVTLLTASSVVVAIAGITAGRQTYLLREAFAEAETGVLIQWDGTVVASTRAGRVVLDAARTDGSGERRVICFNEPGLPVDRLRPGDVLRVQGSPQRDGWVVITDGSRTRWQSLSLLRRGPSGSYV